QRWRPHPCRSRGRATKRSSWARPDIRQKHPDDYADAFGIGAEMPSPRQTVPASAADDVSLAADNLPGKEVRHVGACCDDFTDKFMSDDHRYRDSFGGPVVPFVYVQIGAADTGAVHPNQHVVDAEDRLGHVLEPETTF